MKTLGLNFGHDGAVALIEDGELSCAIALERLSRRKKDRGVTSQAIDYVLGSRGLSFQDVDMVGVCNWFWDSHEGKELCQNKKGFRIKDYHGRDLSPERYREFGGIVEGGWLFEWAGQERPCIYVDHHLAHCLAAFYMSPFDEALSVSVDFSGSFGATEVNNAVHYFSGDEVQLLKRDAEFPLGAYYGSTCDFLGFHPSLTDAGKVMALAAYGEPCPGYAAFSWPHADNHLLSDLFASTLYRHGIKFLPDARIFFPQLPGEGGVPDPRWLSKADWRSERSRNIAATAQAVLEESMLNFLRSLREISRQVSDKLCLSGGTMLNCVCNGRLLKEGPFPEIFLAPACGDDGLAIGAAAAANTPKRVHSASRVAFPGRGYSEAEIARALEGRSHRRIEEPAALVDAVCESLLAGSIVAWFQGGSEFGPRALGHRSILADPRDPRMKDRLNSQVKHREEFRPFGPVILEEAASEWFEIDRPSPFMLFSVPCRRAAEIPAAVHVDGTARLQTVNAQDGGLYYDLVARFGQQTGVPVLINTSFNVQGEPIVETPEDALRCFDSTQIDLLVLGHCLVSPE